jgi:ribosome-associated toxin RatA of RatAB toxin-antitoxin module
MKHVRKSVLLWYSPREMYELVTDCRSYPSFLPWCEHAEVLEEDEGGMTVRLHLVYAGLHHAFTTRNQHAVGESVSMDLIDGPFSVLDGTWLFKPIGQAGSTPACRIEFDLRYAFNSSALEVVLSPVFDRVANTFVDSFVQRAEQVYGAR